jgi:squalene-hopene/tetraprenyl-beta-curcumene cyclase
MRPLALLTLALALPVSPLVADDVLSPPSVPLDPRIDAAKLTRLGLPKLPDPVVQPLPAVHRIAFRAEESGVSPDSHAAARKAIDRGLAYLRAKQAADGSWFRNVDVSPTDLPRAKGASLAVTGLAIKAFTQVREDGKEADLALARATRFLSASLRGGGLREAADGGVGTYVASAVVMGLASTGEHAYADLIDESVRWMTANQWDQGEGVGADADWFGGAGYGRGKRPDLSNTQMMLDALHDAGTSPDDPAVQRALAFVQRTQNVKSNSAPWAQAGSADGGFIYSPANGGESFASENAGEGRYGEIRPEGAPRSLRSYGSMTYAGFKSLLYAGLSQDDPRVRAAFDWIRRNFTFDENPGLGAQGHYYYLYAMARALQAARQESIETAEGAKRAWRDELVAALVKRQREDGSWVNSAERWEESRPELVTVYAVLALEEALKPVRSIE